MMELFSIRNIEYYILVREWLIHVTVWVEYHTYNIEQTKQHREEFLYVSTAIGISKTYTMYDGNKNSG